MIQFPKHGRAAAALSMLAATPLPLTSVSAIADEEPAPSATVESALADTAADTAAQLPATDEAPLEDDTCVVSPVADADEAVELAPVSDPAPEATQAPQPEAPSEIELAATGFSDVPSTHAQYADIMWLSGRAISSGWGDGTFRPNGAVSREAMAAFLYRYAGSPAYTAPARSPFADVPTTHRFYKEISWAAAAGLTSGFPDGTYRPDAVLTRGASAMFLWRLAGTPVTVAGSRFVDVNVCSAQGAAIRWMSQTGITAGYADRSFRAEGALTRADLATFLHRYDSTGYGVQATPARPAHDPAARTKSFRDVPASSTFASDIAWASQTGVASGYSDGSFKPNAAVTRDAMAVLLYRFAGSPDYTAPATSPFKDVATNHPFYKEIAWAAASGITAGYSDGTFRPTEQVSRAAMAAFLFRAAGNPSSPRTQGFKDTNCSEYRTAISWLAAAGISAGYSDGSFKPHAAVERQAAAAFLHRMCAKGYRIAASPWSKVAATKDAIPNECLRPASLPPTPESNKAIARSKMAKYGWNDQQFTCLVNLWNRESGWNHLARNPHGGAYGIPQSLPASKMASAGADWRTNPETQINWGLGYISGRYGTPCSAWAHSERYNWY